MVISQDGGSSKAGPHTDLCWVLFCSTFFINDLDMGVQGDISRFADNTVIQGCQAPG